MIVVVHQHIGKNGHIKTVRNFTHKTNEIVAIIVIQKDIPLFVPPRKNMI
jgi:hypothetical protein